MLQVEYTGQFKRDLKLCKRRNKNLAALQKIMKLIESEQSLGPELKDHILSGGWVGHHELHINPDWLLIYKIVPKKIQLSLFVLAHIQIFLGKASNGRGRPSSTICPVTDADITLTLIKF